MEDFPITDHGTLIQKEVDSKMKPLMIAIFQAQEEDKDRQNKIISLLKNIRDSQTHNIVQDLAIIVLFILMFTFQ